MSELDEWIGRTQTVGDVITARAAQGLRAVLDHESLAVRAGDPLPPGGHWMFAVATARQSTLGRDGHPVHGAFLPPVALPRRMWAGSRIEFGAPLRVGDALEKTSQIVSITPKTGSSGALVFVVVRHTVTGSSGGRVVEDQTLVYREDPKGAAAPGEEKPRPAVPAQFVRRIVPDPVLLFRYSALTFNAHRIHYDAPYATGVEGYRGLVVHGPLLATLMLDLVSRSVPAGDIARFEFSARRPVTLPDEFEVKARREGAGCSVWIESADGVATAGEATLR
jgi:3-methylfumaryl-CoA hydratase